MKLVRHSPSLLPLAVLALAFLSACDNTTTGPSSAPFSQTDLKVGDGAEAVNGKVLQVNYTGWLWDSSKTDQKGVEFDTTTGRGPFSFTLGASPAQVIAGWDQGLVGMKVGGIRRLIIPPSLAYGPNRNGPIPPNSTLVFEIELLDVSDASQ